MRLESPKVSIIIPVYNVEKYLRECLDSACNQTLQEIEIICVDDGSTDLSANILDAYAREDSRIKVIHKKNSGYGHTMNCGLDMATGKYIAFLESDDFMPPHAYETLFWEAEKYQVDIIKGNYMEISGEGPEYQRKLIKVMAEGSKYGKVYDPSTEPWLFYVRMMNCLGLFRRDLIEDYHIRHNETPGASHQDMGFWFQTFCRAKRVVFIDEAFYCYRQDNSGSSMNNVRKVFCIRDEYRYIWEFLKDNPEILAWVAPVYYHRMFGSFLFTYRRLAADLKAQFLYDVFRAEFAQAQQRPDFDDSRFSEKEKSTLEQILWAPEAFFNEHLAQNEVVSNLLRQLGTTQRTLHEYKRRANQEMWHIEHSLEQNADGPKVSVIIPVYNTEKYLAECLESIRTQSLTDIEIICVNDGSSDHSLDILNDYAKVDSRFKVFSQPNMGQSAARNLGMRYSCGKYTYFMDSDDRLIDGALEYLYAEAEKQKLDVLFFDASVVYESEELKEKFHHMEKTYIRPHEYGDVYTGLELLQRFHADKAYRVAPWMQFIRTGHLREQAISYYEGIIYEDNIFTLDNIISANRVSHRKLCLFERRLREGSIITQQTDFRHFYSRLTCYIQMVGIWTKYVALPGAAEEIWEELKEFRIILRRYYSRMTPAEKAQLELLNLTEKWFFADIFKGDALPQTARLRQMNSTDPLLKELQNIKSSRSYRIGRFITWLPRKFRGAIKCFKQHGIRYTFIRIGQHLTGKAR